MIIIGRRYNFPVSFDIKFFFFSASMANILLLGGVSVRQHHSYRLLLIHSRNIVSFRVKFFFVVHCEAMLFLSMILTFWMITQNQ